MQRIRLIITADDYGMCASVNSAIEECMSAGAGESQLADSWFSAQGNLELIRK